MTEHTVRMLTIDDKSVTTSLDRAGYRKMGVLVTAVSTFADAKQSLAKGGISVIVINMDYAGIDACVVTSHFKKDPSFKDIPVVITSVQGAATVRKQALEAGASLFVEQPVPRSYFIEKIKQLLEQETRDDKRVTVLGDVLFVWNNQSIECPIGDLSKSGVLISTDLPIDSQQWLTLEFSIPGDKKPIKVEGEVVRKIEFSDKHPNRPVGLGIRFMSFSGDGKEKLERYVDTSASDDPQLLYYL